MVRLVDYFYEEIGWGIIFAANTVASAYLCLTVDTLGDASLLLHLNLLFGAVYLPWQLIHVSALRKDAVGEEPERTGTELGEGLHRSIHVRKRASDAAAWGGLVGLTWMTAYWAALIPPWIHWVVVVLSR